MGDQTNMGVKAVVLRHDDHDQEIQGGFCVKNSRDLRRGIDIVVGVLA